MSFENSEPLLQKGMSDNAQNTSSPDLSLVICTLNEAGAIRSVILEISETLGEISHEIIVVDDNSDDSTAQEVEAVAELLGNVRLHIRTQERGLSSAAIRGWDLAKGRYLGVMDGDGQHDPWAIRGLAQMILKGDKDLVCASRYMGKTDTGLNPIRDMGSRLATAATGIILRVPLSDPMSGCFIMTREYFMTARPALAGVGFKILVDIASSTKTVPRFGEIKAALRKRQGGKSKLDLRVIADLGALLVEKATGGVLKARFVLFASVGMSGVFISFIVLALFRLLDGGSFDTFAVAQIVAIIVSMTSNFFANNALTFRNQRLKGVGLLAGLLGFYVACLPGGIINYLIGIWLKSAHVEFILAGVIPAFLIGILNFWFSKLLTWRKT